MGFISEEILAGRTWRDHQGDAYELLLYGLALAIDAQLVYEWGAGKSTLALLRAVQRTGGKVISCDINPIKPEWMAERSTEDSLKNWEFHLMNSEKFFDILTKPADMIYIDGCHSFSCVLWEVDHFWNLLKEDGLMVLHDTRSFAPGPGRVMGILEKLGISVVELPFEDGIAVIHKREGDRETLNLKGFFDGTN
jgi:predicted O-methyltransferase YrrM